MADLVLPNGELLEVPDDWSAAQVDWFLHTDPNMVRAMDDGTIRLWDTDAKRAITPVQHYWRVRSNKKATAAEKVWADEFKRRFGEPERVISVKVFERSLTVAVQAVSYGAGGLGIVAALLLLALRMRRRLAGGMRRLRESVARLWGRVMPWVRTDAPVRLLAVAMLAGAMGNRSYDYYTVLRWVTCVVCAYAGVRAMREGQSGWVWTMWTLAAFYNPIMEVELRKETWRCGACFSRRLRRV